MTTWKVIAEAGPCCFGSYVSECFCADFGDDRCDCGSESEITLCACDEDERAIRYLAGTPVAQPSPEIWTRLLEHLVDCRDLKIEEFKSSTSQEIARAILGAWTDESRDRGHL